MTISALASAARSLRSGLRYVLFVSRGLRPCLPSSAPAGLDVNARRASEFYGRFIPNNSLGKKEICDKRRPLLPAHFVRGFVC